MQAVNVKGEDARLAADVDVWELLLLLWRQKWLIAIVTSVAAILSVALALYLPNVYRSQVLLAPSETQKGGGLSGLAAQMGGLASLAGVNLGDGKADKTDIAIEVGKSRLFVTQFIRRHQLEVPLMAATRWKKQTNALLVDGDIYDVKQRKWVRVVKEGESVAPTDWELYKAFLEWFSLTKDKKSGLVTLVVDFYSPIMAKQWADFFVKDINDAIKARDQAEAQHNIDYLKKQLEKTTLSGMQSVFYQLIEEQTKTLMLADVQQEYVFKVLDPAVVAEEKQKPKRAIVVLVGTALGFIAAAAIVLMRRNKLGAC